MSKIPIGNEKYRGKYFYDTESRKFYNTESGFDQKGGEVSDPKLLDELRSTPEFQNWKSRPTYGVEKDPLSGKGEAFKGDLEGKYQNMYPTKNTFSATSPKKEIYYDADQKKFVKDKMLGNTKITEPGTFNSNFTNTFRSRASAISDVTDPKLLKELQGEMGLPFEEQEGKFKFGETEQEPSLLDSEKASIWGTSQKRGFFETPKEEPKEEVVQGGGGPKTPKDYQVWNSKYSMSKKWGTGGWEPDSTYVPIKTNYRTPNRVETITGTFPEVKKPYDPNYPKRMEKETIIQSGNLQNAQKLKEAEEEIAKLEKEQVSNAEKQTSLPVKNETKTDTKITPTDTTPTVKQETTTPKTSDLVNTPPINQGPKLTETPKVETKKQEPIVTPKEDVKATDKVYNEDLKKEQTLSEYAEHIKKSSGDFVEIDDETAYQYAVEAYKQQQESKVKPADTKSTTTPSVERKVTVSPVKENENVNDVNNLPVPKQITPKEGYIEDTFTNPLANEQMKVKNPEKITTTPLPQSVSNTTLLKKYEAPKENVTSNSKNINSETKSELTTNSSTRENSFQSQDNLPTSKTVNPMNESVVNTKPVVQPEVTSKTNTESDVFSKETRDNLNKLKALSGAYDKLPNVISNHPNSQKKEINERISDFNKLETDLKAKAKTEQDRIAVKKWKEEVDSAPVTKSAYLKQSYLVNDLEYEKQNSKDWTPEKEEQLKIENAKTQYLRMKYDEGQLEKRNEQVGTMIRSAKSVRDELENLQSTQTKESIESYKQDMIKDLKKTIGNDTKMNETIDYIFTYTTEMKEAETLIKQGKSKEEVSTLLMKKHNLTKEQADKIVIISKY